MKQVSPKTNDDRELDGWLRAIDDLSRDAVNFTIGLISGCRENNERSAIDRLAVKALSPVAGRGLLVRLSLEEDGEARSLRSAKNLDNGPVLVPSSLGPWKEAVVAMQLGLTAPASLMRLPRWLSRWKRDFSRIVIDLGPIHQPVCRTVGRYCDTSYLLLGPISCAGPLWIRSQLDILTNCHVAISGSVLLSAEPSDAYAA